MLKNKVAEVTIKGFKMNKHQFDEYMRLNDILANKLEHVAGICNTYADDAFPPKLEFTEEQAEAQCDALIGYQEDLAKKLGINLDFLRDALSSASVNRWEFYSKIKGL